MMGGRRVLPLTYEDVFERPEWVVRRLQRAVRSAA